jgi:hypothetical protein
MLGNFYPPVRQYYFSMLGVAFQKTYSTQISWRSMPMLSYCAGTDIAPLTFAVCFVVSIRKIKTTPPKKSPVKLHKWTFEEDKAFIEFISVAENHANDYGLPIM